MAFNQDQIRELRFQLIRICHGAVADDGEELCALVRDNGIPAEDVYMIMTSCCFDKINTAISLSKLFLRNMMIDYAKYMLEQVQAAQLM